MRTRLSLVVLLVVAGVGTPFYLMSAPRAEPVMFPDGKRFAFSIVDDTDMATLERLVPIYELLERYGLRTTKTVWVYDTNTPQNETNAGASLRSPEYRAFISQLQQKGFEIALHGVRGGSSRREETLAGLEEFNQILGHYPRMFVNHSLNQENLYWGGNLFTFAPLRWAGRMAIPYEFSGHESDSPYFWGDVARQRITYVRRYTFPDINLLNVNPSFPYRLPEKPFVNYWFPTANGDRMIEFDALLSPENVERLVREGGVCLVYAHLGAGSFNDDADGVDPRFEARLKELVKHDGWFVPASEILDYLARRPGWSGNLDFHERARIDLRYLAGQLMARLGFGALT